MAIYLPRRWRHQPSGPCEIDWRHPLARGLSVAYFPSQGVFGRGDSPSYVGTVSRRVPTQTGDADDCAAGTHFAADSWVADVGRYSGALVMSLTPTADVIFSRTYLFGARNGTSGSSRLQARRLSGNWVGLNVSTTNIIDPEIPFPTGVRATFGVSLDTSTVRGVFNGEQFHASGSALSATPTHLVVNSLVTIDNKSNFANATMLHSFATWSRPLTVDEHRAWHENPWQILRAQPRRIFFDLGAASPLPTLSLPGVTDIGTTSARPRVTVTY